MIDDFLEAEAFREAVEQFPSFEAKHAINEIRRGGRQGRARDWLSWGRPTPSSTPCSLAEFSPLGGAVSDIEDLLFDPDYVGGGTHENIDRQELDAHVDFTSTRRPGCTGG
ncbi:MAG: hypothetical protein R2724_14295 [Bryobacterales bacterium]